MAELVGPIQHKRGTTAQWAASTIPLRDGELGIDTTVRRMKVGDGATLFPALPWQDVDQNTVERLEAAAAIVDEASTPNDAAMTLVQADPTSAFSVAQKATIGALAVAQGANKLKPATIPDGPPAAASTGQAVTSFGNTPLKVAGGVVTNTPVPDSPAANMAGYQQSFTRAAGKARLIWARVRASANANCGLTLLLPGQPWANGSLTRAEAHNIWYPNGVVEGGIWTGSAVEKYIPDSVIAPWNDGKERFIATIVDPDGTVTLRNPDGSILASAPGAIDYSKISQYGVAEIYRQVNTTGNPAVPITIVDWGITDASDMEALAMLGIPSFRDLKSATDPLRYDVPSREHAPTTAVEYIAPTATAIVDPRWLRVKATVPASGRLLITGSVFLRVSAACHYLLGLVVTRNLAATWSHTLVGAPTGGSYVIQVNGKPTAAIAYNATAADVAAAINAISAATGISGVTASGSGTMTITFPVSVTLTNSHTLTGGTNPGVSLVGPTVGSGGGMRREVEFPGAFGMAKPFSFKLTGLPVGESVTATLRHFCTVAATGKIVADGPSGYFNEMVAAPTTDD